MNDDLIKVFTIFITTQDKELANRYFLIMQAHFIAHNKDTNYFEKLKDSYLTYEPGEIIGIKSALKVEFENLSGLRVH